MEIEETVIHRLQAQCERQFIAGLRLHLCIARHRTNAERTAIPVSLSSGSCFHILELQIIQPAVGAGTCHQALVGALIDDHAVFQHQNAIGAAHG